MKSQFLKETREEKSSRISKIITQTSKSRWMKSKLSWLIQKLASIWLKMKARNWKIITTILWPKSKKRRNWWKNLWKRKKLESLVCKSRCLQLWILRKNSFRRKLSSIEVQQIKSSKRRKNLKMCSSSIRKDIQNLIRVSNNREGPYNNKKKK
jgi:hypothetical protein